MGIFPSNNKHSQKVRNKSQYEGNKPRHKHCTHHVTTGNKDY